MRRVLFFDIFGIKSRYRKFTSAILTSLVIDINGDLFYHIEIGDCDAMSAHTVVINDVTV